MLDIRIISISEVKEYWNLRLRALKDHPEAFAASYEDAVNQSIEQVTERFPNSPDHFLFGAYNSHGKLVGMVGFRQEQMKKMRHKGTIWGMYVIPEERGKGIGRKLLSAAIDRARELPELEQINLAVVTTNLQARNLYLSLGFKPLGLEKRALKLGERYFDEEYMVLFL